MTKAGIRWASTWSAPSCASSSTTMIALDALAHRLVEDEAVRRERHREEAEVERAPAPRVVGVQGALDVVDGVGAGGDDVPVDRHLAVGVEVVQEPEAAGERVRVRRHAAGRPGDAVVVEQLEARVAVAARG